MVITSWSASNQFDNLVFFPLNIWSGHFQFGCLCYYIFTKVGLWLYLINKKAPHCMFWAISWFICNHYGRMWLRKSYFASSKVTSWNISFVMVNFNNESRSDDYMSAQSTLLYRQRSSSFLRDLQSRLLRQTYATYAFSVAQRTHFAAFALPTCVPPPPCPAFLSVKQSLFTFIQ